MPHYQPIIDHEVTGRALAERLRTGPGYIFDVRERFKARIRARRKESCND